MSADIVVRAVEDADPAPGQACGPGVRAYESGDFWSAPHVMAPRIERGVRTVGAHLQAPIHRVAREQRLLFALLDPMLVDPIIREALTDESARGLQALLTSEYRPNIRNHVAYGAVGIASAEAETMACLLSVLQVADVLASLPETSEDAVDDDT